MKTNRPNQQHAPRGKEREQKKMSVRDVMTTSVSFVEPDETVVDVAKKLSQLDVGSMPVCEDGQLVGMITDRDIVVRVLAEEQPLDSPIGDAMTGDVVCAHEDDDINALVKTMQEREVRRVPVVDEDNKLIGIVALADLARSDASPSLKAKGLEGVS